MDTSEQAFLGTQRTAECVNLERPQVGGALTTRRVSAAGRSARPHHLDTLKLRNTGAIHGGLAVSRSVDVNADLAGVSESTLDLHLGIDPRPLNYYFQGRHLFAL